MANLVKINNKRIQLGNVNKTIYAEAAISKGAVIEYYKSISEFMLPYLKDRPLMLQRFPNGITRRGFYQKEKPDYFPQWIESVTVSKREGGSITHILCNDAATLVYLANQASIVIHTWQSKKDDPEYPDRIVIDHDPFADDFGALKGSLGKLKEYLDALNITTYPMTTGSKGFHILIPVLPKKTYEEIRTILSVHTQKLAEIYPHDFTTATRKVKRGKLIYLDVQRNGYGQTSVAPYSLRAKTYAPVATPVTWEEALSPDISPREYTMGNILKRMSQTDNPWPGYFYTEIAIENLKAISKEPEAV